MARTVRFTAGADTFVQGFNIQNTTITLFMLGGNDTVLLDRDDDFGGRNHVDAGAGNDVVESHREDGSLILLGAGNDRYGGTGFGSFASDRPDTVRGGAGNDQIGATTFKSLYFGDAGNDTFFSSGQRNSFFGGQGRDMIDYRLRDSGAVTVDLGRGFAQTGPIAQETLRGIEDVRGTADIAGDVLIGSAAANRIIGDGGFDLLTGRGGADTFIWTDISEAPMASDAIDIITDFSAAQNDLVDLVQIDANALRTGNQAFRFIADGAFTGRAGQLRFSDLILEGDVNGDGLADFRIGLRDVASLAADDILL